MAALRRYAEEIDEIEGSDGRVSVSMRSGVGEVDDGEALLGVGGRRFRADGGEYTAIVASGDLEAKALETVLGRLRTDDIDPVAAAGAEGSATIVVERSAAPNALRIVEDAV